MNHSKTIFVKLRATESRTGNAQLRITFFAGENSLAMQNAGDVLLTELEYEQAAVGLLMAAALSKGEMSVSLEGWGADQFNFKHVRWLYDMNIKEALDVDLAPDQGSLAVLDESGDTRIVWNRDVPLEVEIARGAFNKAKARGYMAYKVEGKEGKKAEVMHHFDPEAERIILAPALAGGSDQCQ